MATTSTLQDALPTLTPSPNPNVDDATHPRTMHPVLAFLIGLAIILGASIMNAGGLNITKLDHSRQASIPRASRKRDWLRPLWLLGILLYILSQLVGSTLALEFMRAEYVAPLGSTSLIFNFIFASLLIGTPVTSNDIYGTVIIVIGVIGIVLFGSINSGLKNEMDINRLSSLWARSGWLVFFILMSLALIVLYICISQLDAVLATRADLSSIPFASSETGTRRADGTGSYLKQVVHKYNAALAWIREWMEHWTAAKSDKQIAWTLGIGWACCGGGLAGGCLVFAKACVKLISGTLNHQNTGNQFGHPATIFTFIFLALTAVFQIICLNRGLRVYDSTLVVPVFYGVYTASGFLNSLIFNDQVDAYQSWDLFLIFLSIAILIAGVVLLTNKKPEKLAQQPGTGMALATLQARTRPKDGKANDRDGDVEAEAFRPREPDDHDEEAVWQIGNADDDDEYDGVSGQERGAVHVREVDLRKGEGSRLTGPGDETSGLMNADEGDDDEEETSASSGSTRVAKDDDFGDWETADRTR